MKRHHLMQYHCHRQEKQTAKEVLSSRYEPSGYGATVGPRSRRLARKRGGFTSKLDENNRLSS